MAEKTEKIALDIQIKTLDSAKSIGELKTGIKELTKELEKLPEGSEQFKKTAAFIGGAKDKLGDLNQEIAQTTTKAGKFQAILGVGQQIANGFQLAQSAMALFGSESEAVTQALQKAQAAMQFVQGLKELEGVSDSFSNAKSVILDFNKTANVAFKDFFKSAYESIKGIKDLKFNDVMSSMKNGITGFVKSGISSLRALWAAMLSNPLTLILIGLTALGGAIAWLVTRESEETKELRKNVAEREKAIDSLNREKEAANQNAKFRMDLLKAQGASEKQLFEAEQKIRKERETALAKENQVLFDQMRNLGQLRAKADDDEAKELTDKINKINDQIKKNNEEKLQFERDYQIKKATLATADRKAEEEKLKEQQAKAKEAAKQRAENRKAEEEKIKADLERNRVEELKNLENQRKAKELDGTLTYEDKKKYYDDVYELEIQKSGLIAEDLEELRLKHLENLKNLDAEEQKRKKEKEDEALAGIKKDQADQLSEYETRIKTQQRLGEDSTALELEAAKYKLDTILNDENASYEQRLAAQEEYNAKVQEIEDKANERQKRNKQFAIDSTLETLKVIQDLTLAFAGQSEAQQRKAFNINKAAQIAEATISSILAAQKAYTSQIIPGDPSSPIRGAIAAALAVAAGIARVKKIASTQFEGGGGGAAGGMEGAAGGAGGAMSAPLQGGVNNTSTMLENMGQGQQEQKPIKAYVLQTDVASEDQKMKAIENKSKIE